MNGVETITIECPYCGESIDVVVDCSAGQQRYIEDCRVCCRPMQVAVAIDADGIPGVAVFREDEA